MWVPCLLVISPRNLLIGGGGVVLSWWRTYLRSLVAFVLRREAPPNFRHRAVRRRGWRKSCSEHRKPQELPRADFLETVSLNLWAYIRLRHLSIASALASAAPTKAHLYEFSHWGADQWGSVSLMLSGGQEASFPEPVLGMSFSSWRALCRRSLAFNDFPKRSLHLRRPGGHRQSLVRTTLGCVYVAKYSTPKRLGLELWFCHYLVVWPQTSDLASVSSSIKQGSQYLSPFGLSWGLNVMKCAQHQAWCLTGKVLLNWILKALRQRKSFGSLWILDQGVVCSFSLEELPFSWTRLVFCNIRSNETQVLTRPVVLQSPSQAMEGTWRAH